MVRHQQHIGAQSFGLSQQSLLLRALNIARQQHAAAPVGNAQHTRQGIRFGRALAHRRVIRDPWVQKRELHAIPFPALPGFATGQRCQPGQGLRNIHRGQHLRGTQQAQHRCRAAGVVAVAVAEHQPIQAHALGLQQRHQHPVARITVQTIARPAVVKQGVVRGLHQHRIALPDVSRQQREFARWRTRGLPQQHASDQRQASAAQSRTPGQHQRDSTDQARQQQPPGGQRHDQRGTGPGGQAARACQKKLCGQGCGIPQRWQEYTGDGQRREH